MTSSIEAKEVPAVALIANVLVALVVAIHVYIVILEMFLWRTPRGLKAFSMDQDFADRGLKLMAKELNVPAKEIPTSTSRGKETFFDGKVFDPDNPAAYLKSLSIKRLEV
jgi:hypothetical protein